MFTKRKFCWWFMHKWIEPTVPFPTPDGDIRIPSPQGIWICSKCGLKWQG